MTDVTTGPDLAAIKQRQQATWASGDYHMIGTQILIVSELDGQPTSVRCQVVQYDPVEFVRLLEHAEMTRIGHQRELRTRDEQRHQLGLRPKL